MTRANPLDSLDLTEFETKPAERKPKQDREVIAKMAEENGFPSRQAPKTEAQPAKAKQEAAPAVKRKQRRHTTGRNQQINVKATGETIAKFNRIADAENLPLGELLDRALDAYERERKSGR